MSNRMKKFAACLTALLMIATAVPVLAETYSSGMIAGSPSGFKEALDIVASRGTVMLVGQTLEMDVNEDYIVTWKSENEAIATIDAEGVITGIAEGTVTITAETKDQKAKTEITVIDPEPLIAEEIPTEEPAEGPAEGPAENPEEGQTDEPAPAPAAKRAMVIVINGENDRVTFDGEEHVLNTFVATSNDDSFDAGKIRTEGEFGVAATDCGFYELQLEGIVFTYDDPEVAAHFVVNNSWLRITPATVVVTANDSVKEEGAADPELSASVSGLFGDDRVEYTLTRAAGEAIGEYVIEATGEELQGNYRVEYVAGRFEITSAPTVVVESSIPSGATVYKGTEITLRAVTAGFGERTLTYRWQWSTDGENWTDIEGATQAEYTYTVSRKNAKYMYRVCVDPVD